jgi:hypothetical protein
MAVNDNDDQNSVEMAEGDDLLSGQDSKAQNEAEKVGDNVVFYTTYKASEWFQNASTSARNVGIAQVIGLLGRDVIQTNSR